MRLSVLWGEWVALVIAVMVGAIAFLVAGALGVDGTDVRVAIGAGIFGLIGVGDLVRVRFALERESLEGANALLLQRVDALEVEVHSLRYPVQQGPSVVLRGSITHDSPRPAVLLEVVNRLKTDEFKADFGLNAPRRPLRWILHPDEFRPITGDGGSEWAHVVSFSIRPNQHGIQALYVREPGGREGQSLFGPGERGGDAAEWGGHVSVHSKEQEIHATAFIHLTVEIFPEGRGSRTDLRVEQGGQVHLSSYQIVSV